MKKTTVKTQVSSLSFKNRKNADEIRRRGKLLILIFLFSRLLNLGCALGAFGKLLNVILDLDGIVGRVCGNVNASYCGLKYSHFTAVSARFDNAGLVLDAYYLADNSADSGDLVSYLKVISHIVNKLLLLLLGADRDKIEYRKESYQNEKGHHICCARKYKKHIIHFVVSNLFTDVQMELYTKEAQI